MGLTVQSVASKAIDRKAEEKIKNNSVCTVALAGNPNVGKSTLFNYLTGMKQHTGNWAGKTVSNAVGTYKNGNKTYNFVDLPGTYSLMANSAEETVARDFICFGHADAIVVVCDATCLERNLNLVLQTLQISNRVIVCVNLLDEAKKKGICINLAVLKQKLGVPVVGITARSGKGIDKLLREIDKIQNKEFLNIAPTIQYPAAIENAIEVVSQPLAEMCCGIRINPRWIAIKLLENDTDLIKKTEQNYNLSLTCNDSLVCARQCAQCMLNEQGFEKSEFKDLIASGLILSAEEICDNEVINFKNCDYYERDLKIDRFLTGKITGPIVMILLLAVVFWITIVGANYPSEMLWNFFSFIETQLMVLAKGLKCPDIISQMLICGVYRVLAWVVSVMLPPMAIFFPLFTILEDVGYLPRVAFNLDKKFQKCNACGKQALTTCMGFGCNAAGVTGCRIIDSPRERLIAVLTNSFVPCNGRFPTLISIISMFFIVSSGKTLQSVLSTALLTAAVFFSIAMTFITSKLLSVTVLKGKPSSFVLELPPYRKPKIGSVLVRSMLDRTIFVLGRAVCVAAPAGLLIWTMANVRVHDQTILNICSNFLNPFAELMGLDGVILLGFILGFPANEIVVPIIVMSYLSNGSLAQYTNLSALHTLLINNNWTIETAICVIIFSLMHWPCSTTLITIKKETKSIRWTLAAFLLPTICGIICCMLVHFIFRLF